MFRFNVVEMEGAPRTRGRKVRGEPKGSDLPIEYIVVLGTRYSSGN
jgi:hypothetical protein